MTIHPYLAALESEVVLRDGTRVAIRPMRPDDAGLETRFVDGLSEQSRYQRFMQRRHRGVRLGGRGRVAGERAGADPA